MATQKPFKGKHIILAMPQRYEMYRLVIENLEFLGFEVTDVSFQDEFFHYRNTGEKITNFFRKTFLKDKDYKTVLKFRHQQETIENRLLKLQKKADFSLVIRPDLYPNSILNLIKEKSLKSIAYQWDGLQRFPKVIEQIPLFNRFFVFDPEDVSEKTAGITNFFFSPEIFEKKTTNTELDLYFLGIYIEHRMPFIKSFAEKIKSLPLKSELEVYTENPEKISPEFKNLTTITYSTEKKTYREVLEKNLTAKILVEFVNPEHKGLSFRIFEALGTHKKVLTTNPEVLKYDFYHPDNIMVINHSTDKDDLLAFLKKPYHILPETIYKKYGFENWLKNITGEPDAIPVLLPQ